MAKRVAVLAVNPVNGSGLFQYLEAFYENGVPFTLFAVADGTQIKTNSGIGIAADDVVANLKGHEDEYDAVVFACGDAIPKFAENADRQFNLDMLAILKDFADRGKIVAGHCALAMFLDGIDSCSGKRVALHPYIQPVVKNVVATNDEFVTDGNIHTARTEDTVGRMIPTLLQALK